IIACSCSFACSVRSGSSIAIRELASEVTPTFPPDALLPAPAEAGRRPAHEKRAKRSGPPRRAEKERPLSSAGEERGRKEFRTAGPAPGLLLLLDDQLDGLRGPPVGRGVVLVGDRLGGLGLDRVLRPQRVGEALHRAGLDVAQVQRHLARRDAELL